jgi:hypothetical protein
VTRRSSPADREQALLGLGRGDPCQRPHLRVRQLAARQGLGKAWERHQRARHADPLARGAEIQPHAPREPVRARAKAVAPAAPRVELADQVEQALGGGVEVRRRGVLLNVARLYTAISEAPERLHVARSRRDPPFVS